MSPDAPKEDVPGWTESGPFGDIFCRPTFTFPGPTFTFPGP